MARPSGRVPELGRGWPCHGRAGLPLALNLMFEEGNCDTHTLFSPLTGQIVHGGHFHQVPPHDA